MTLTCKKEPSVVPPQNRSDTTSHNFAWELDSLGDASVGSSILHDVAIVSDTVVWAVGEIYAKDSTGRADPIAYNAAKWDGKKWQLLRILFYTVCGQQSTTPYSTNSIFAISSTDIWISAGDQITRWNGNSQTETMCLPVSFTINRLWGNNSNSVYAVGNGGNILHYTNGVWQQVQSGYNNRYF